MSEISRNYRSQMFGTKFIKTVLYVLGDPTRIFHLKLNSMRKSSEKKHAKTRRIRINNGTPVGIIVVSRRVIKRQLFVNTFEVFTSGWLIVCSHSCEREGVNARRVHDCRNKNNRLDFVASMKIE